MRRVEIYAVIRTGGKQYKVEPNQLLDVERLPDDVGAVVELSDVLLVADGDDVTVGQPRVPGARVVAEVVHHGRGPKMIVFKYKPKTRYRKKTGHRQDYTRLAIRQILVGAEPVAEAPPAKPQRRRAPPKPAKAEVAPPDAVEVALQEAPQAAAEIPVTEAAPVEEAPAAEATPVEEAPAAAAEEAPKTRRRKAAAPPEAGEAPAKPPRRTKRGE